MQFIIHFMVISVYIQLINGLRSQGIWPQQLSKNNENCYSKDNGGGGIVGGTILLRYWLIFSIRTLKITFLLKCLPFMMYHYWTWTTLKLLNIKDIELNLRPRILCILCAVYVPGSWYLYIKNNTFSLIYCRNQRGDEWNARGGEKASGCRRVEQKQTVNLFAKAKSNLAINSNLELKHHGDGLSSTSAPPSSSVRHT